MITSWIAVGLSAVLIGPPTWTEAAATAPDLAQESHVSVGEPSRARQLGVCFQNMTEDTFVAMFSSNFLEPEHEAFDAVGADDVRIGESGCRARRLQVPGSYYSGTGPAESVTVVFYANNGGLPGRVISTQTLVGDDSQGSFDLELKPVRLKAEKRYWVSVQANISFTCCHMWGWENTNHGVGLPAVWRNPGDGFGSGCIDWDNMQHCFGGVAPGPDFMFTLMGRQPNG